MMVVVVMMVVGVMGLELRVGRLHGGLVVREAEAVGRGRLLGQGG